MISVPANCLDCGVTLTKSNRLPSQEAKKYAEKHEVRNPDLGQRERPQWSASDLRRDPPMSGILSGLMREGSAGNGQRSQGGALGALSYAVSRAPSALGCVSPSPAVRDSGRGHFRFSEGDA